MLNSNFILSGNTSEFLYHTIAKNAPIYDYHCHLSAKEIYEDKEFEDIVSLWLKFDHYKWRAMRYAGYGEDIVTGNVDGLLKFKAWAKTCERLIGSPLYHWANMELNTYFGIDEILNENNAEKIYDICNNKIRKEALSPVKMIQSANVKLICTTDDPIDNLEHHKLIRQNKTIGFQVLPSFRPDKALNILNEGYTAYLKQLSESSKININTYHDLVQALKDRIEFFREAGCLLSDHSLESLSYHPATQSDVENIFARRIAGDKITKDEAEKFKLHLLLELATQYRSSGWVMQLHIGAFRNTNEVMFRKLGVDAGFDIMNDFEIAEPLTYLLNAMNNRNGLPKIILYTLNPKDNLFLSALPHCFPEDGVVGKIQFGPAWWFNDNKEEIVKHLKSIANQGMLAYFTGMLTDSRSFLSYVRHDYFRRILCNLIGDLVDNGEFVKDEALLKEILEGICYKNIINYLGLEEES
jgi:glucuronate isomerase